MQEFFAIVREAFGPLSQTQVDGCNVLLKATEGLSTMHRAYILATAYHETAHTMQPIEEYGKGAGKSYGQPAGAYGKRYYGRGYVQLTHLSNYQKASLATGRDLVRYPEQAMDPDVAADIIVRGMSQGWFTGKKMSDFTTYRYMRLVVNGMDKADLIASYANTFERALKAIPCNNPHSVTHKDDSVSPVTPKRTLFGLLLSLILKLLGKSSGVRG
jgi:putative chitinase